jgi:hypothetical protein
VDAGLWLQGHEFQAEIVDKTGAIHSGTVVEIEGMRFDKNTGNELYFEEEGHLHTPLDAQDSRFRLEQHGNVFMLAGSSSKGIDHYFRSEVLAATPVMIGGEELNFNLVKELSGRYGKDIVAMVRLISKDKAQKIKETGLPKGFFFYKKSGQKYVGMYNLESVSTEQFLTLKDCLSWLLFIAELDRFVNSQRSGHTKEIAAKRSENPTPTTIKFVGKETGHKIIETRAPKGLFFLKDVARQRYIGIDNTTGDAWVEEFSRVDDCFRWLTGLIEADRGEEVRQSVRQRVQAAIEQRDFQEKQQPKQERKLKQEQEQTKI